MMTMIMLVTEHRTLMKMISVSYYLNAGLPVYKCKFDKYYAYTTPYSLMIKIRPIDMVNRPMRVLRTNAIDCSQKHLQETN